MSISRKLILLAAVGCLMSMDTIAAQVVLPLESSLLIGEGQDGCLSKDGTRVVLLQERETIQVFDTRSSQSSLLFENSKPRYCWVDRQGGGLFVVLPSERDDGAADSDDIPKASLVYLADFATQSENVAWRISLENFTNSELPYEWQLQFQSLDSRQLFVLIAVDKNQKMSSLRLIHAASGREILSEPIRIPGVVAGIEDESDSLVVYYAKYANSAKQIVVSRAALNLEAGRLGNVQVMQRVPTAFEKWRNPFFYTPMWHSPLLRAGPIHAGDIRQWATEVFNQHSYASVAQKVRYANTLCKLDQDHVDPRGAISLSKSKVVLTFESPKNRVVTIRDICAIPEGYACLTWGPSPRTGPNHPVADSFEFRYWRIQTEKY